MKVVSGLGLIVLGALFSTSIFAKPIRCDTCTTRGDFMREAEAAGSGTHIVFNVKDQLISQWIVPYNPATGGGGGVVPLAVTPTREISVPAGATEELRRAHELYVQGGGTLRPIIVAPVEKLGVNPSVREKTAYDFVLDRNMQAMIETAAGSPAVISQLTSAGILAALADLSTLATAHLGLRDQAALMFKIVFKDGSYVIIKVDLAHAMGQYEPDSARTSAGQKIPTDVQEAQGEWTNYNGEDLSRMAEHMRILGAQIQIVGSAGGTIRTITCSGAGVAKICIAETSQY